jgi:hypothetical protein
LGEDAELEIMAMMDAESSRMDSIFVLMQAKVLHNEPGMAAPRVVT